MGGLVSWSHLVISLTCGNLASGCMRQKIILQWYLYHNDHTAYSISQWWTFIRASVSFQSTNSTTSNPLLVHFHFYSSSVPAGSVISCKSGMLVHDCHWLQTEGYHHATYCGGSICKSGLLAHDRHRLQAQGYHHATYSGGSICECGLSVCGCSLWLWWTDKPLLRKLSPE